MSIFSNPFGDSRAIADLEANKVAGPASSVDENIAVFDGITGKLVKDGGVKVSGLEPVIATKNTAFNKDFGTTAGTVMEGDDARLVWMLTAHAISGNQSGDVTITPANGHRQSVTINGAVTALICALSATYPAIVLEITTTGDFALDLSGWQTDGGGAIVLPDTGTCILVLQLSADGTTQYAYLAATEVS